MLVIVPAAALNVAVVELAAIVTEAGTVRAALLEDRATVVLPLRAALDSVTVQVVLALDARLDAPHVREDKLTGP